MLKSSETLRIKTFLVVDRNATRDYLDVAALSYYIGLKKSAAALESMNELYAEFKDEAGDLLTSVVVKLSVPDPYDLTDIDLSEYKGIVAPWNNWRAVQAQCASRRSLDCAAPVTIFRSAHIAGLSHRNNAHESSARRGMRAPRMTRLRIWKTPYAAGFSPEQPGRQAVKLL
jgi:hypothetical protein